MAAMMAVDVIGGSERGGVFSLAERLGIMALLEFQVIQTTLVGLVDITHSNP